MMLPLKWITPILLRILALSHSSLASSTAATFSQLGSVHLVVQFGVGLVASPADVLSAPQPRSRFDTSLDSSTFVQLTNQELLFPIMPL
jgi:hypothetical protein